MIKKLQRLKTIKKVVTNLVFGDRILLVGVKGVSKNMKWEIKEKKCENPLK